MNPDARDAFIFTVVHKYSDRLGQRSTGSLQPVQHNSPVFVTISLQGWCSTTEPTPAATVWISLELWRRVALQTLPSPRLNNSTLRLRTASTSATPAGSPTSQSGLCLHRFAGHVSVSVPREGHKTSTSPSLFFFKVSHYSASSWLCRRSDEQAGSEIIRPP